MSIQYAPQPGSILLCDFEGRVPEMVKRRPVIVLSSVSPNLAIVVPLSTTWPEPPQPWHYLVRFKKPFPGVFNKLECWAKCDMVSVVSFVRLRVMFDGKDKEGKRQYVVPKLSKEDLEAVRVAVMHAIRG